MGKSHAKLQAKKQNRDFQASRWGRHLYLTLPVLNFNCHWQHWNRTGVLIAHKISLPFDYFFLPETPCYDIHLVFSHWHRISFFNFCEIALSSPWGIACVLSVTFWNFSGRQWVLETSLFKLYLVVQSAFCNIKCFCSSRRTCVHNLRN